MRSAVVRVFMVRRQVVVQLFMRLFSSVVVISRQLSILCVDVAMPVRIAMTRMSAATVVRSRADLMILGVVKLSMFVLMRNSAVIVLIIIVVAATSHRTRLEIVHVLPSGAVILAMVEIHLKRLLDIVLELEVLSPRVLRFHLENKVATSRESILRMEDARV